MIQNKYYRNKVEDYYRAGKTVGFIDEVGRGSLAGDLYACCVVMKDSTFFDCTINDSKKIDKKNMEILANLIKKNIVEYKLGIVTVAEINATHNISEATFLAMERSVLALQNKPDILFIDGPWCIRLDIGQCPVIKGDTLIFGIACASIVAKSARDEYMKGLHAVEPYYAWNTNAGYGSQKHFAGMRLHGLSVHHRTYFKGVAENEKHNQTTL